MCVTLKPFTIQYVSDTITYIYVTLQHAYDAARTEHYNYMRMTEHMHMPLHVCQHLYIECA